MLMELTAMEGNTLFPKAGVVEGRESGHSGEERGGRGRQRHRLGIFMQK